MLHGRPPYAISRFYAHVRQMSRLISFLVASEPLTGGTELRPVSGGLLIQQRDELDAHGDNPVNWTLATGKPAKPKRLRDGPDFSASNSSRAVRLEYSTSMILRM